MPVSQTVKKSTCNAGDLGFNSWVGKILWRRAWQHTSVFLPGESSWTEEPRGLQSISSVQFSCSVVSDSLQPHGLQHTRPPCPSPPPRAWSSSCPSSQWCHPTISSSVIHICIIYEYIYIYIHPCMILYAALHKCTDHPIIQSYTLLSLQRYIGYSPRPSYRWPKKFCTSEHEIKIFLLFSKAKELFLKVLVLKTAWQHVFIL